MSETKYNIIDAEVGKKLRERRTMLGISQESLGASSGISFQQIQKYEKGLNRVSASRLFEFAKILGVDANFFFSSCEEKNEYNQQQGLAEGENDFNYDYQPNLKAKEIMSLVKSYSSIKDLKVRRQILSLILALSKESGSNELTNKLEEEISN